MRRAVQRAVRLILSPDEEWRAIAREPQEPWLLLGSFVLPLACIPAGAWSLSLSLLGREDGRSGERVTVGLAQIVLGGLSVWAYSVLSVLMLASSTYILAPLFVDMRDWARALKVGAFSAAPVLLGGIILVVPEVSYAILLLAFHSCYLMYVGLQRVLHVKERNAAECVALCIVMFTIASTALGSLGGALGVL